MTKKKGVKPLPKEQLRNNQISMFYNDREYLIIEKQYKKAKENGDADENERLSRWLAKIVLSTIKSMDNK